MSRVLSAALLLLAAAVFSAPGGTACNPPCGPIPVILEVKLEKFRNLTFGDGAELFLEGTVSYYVNVDQDGFSYDPQNKPKIAFKVNKQAPWIETSVRPESFEVPVDDAQYLSSESGSAGEVQYLWSAPISVTVKRLRDPAPEELTGKWIRGDGTYRATISAASTASITGGDTLGTPVGLQEGYGVRELRFDVTGIENTLPNGQDVPKAPGLAWSLEVIILLALALGARGRRAR